jgi:hypothetical protein
VRATNLRDSCEEPVSFDISNEATAAAGKEKSKLDFDHLEPHHQSRDVVFTNQKSALAAWRGNREKYKQLGFTSEIEIHIHIEGYSGPYFFEATKSMGT